MRTRVSATSSWGSISHGNISIAPERCWRSTTSRPQSTFGAASCWKSWAAISLPPRTGSLRRAKGIRTPRNICPAGPLFPNLSEGPTGSGRKTKRSIAPLSRLSHGNVTRWRWNGSNGNQTWCSDSPDSVTERAESGIPFRQALIRNHYVGRTFIEPSQAIRDFGVKLKLNPVRHLLQGKRVVLVDDSIVRGTTSRKIVRMVRQAGAREVHVRISCPPTISPCFYGVDTPTKRELIA